jgi:hypothetical protein
MGNDVQSSKPGNYKVFEISAEITVAIASNPNSPAFINIERAVNDEGKNINKIILKELNKLDYIQIFRRKGNKLAIIWPISKDKDFQPISFRYTGKSTYLTFQVLCNMDYLLKKDDMPAEYTKNKLKRVEWVVSEVIPLFETAINDQLSNISLDKFFVYELPISVKEGPEISEEKVFDAVMTYAKSGDLQPGLRNDKLSFIEDDFLINCACF